MKEAKIDLWTDNFDICITTNGYVKSNGKAVMGRGCALEAKQRIPNIDKILGDAINKLGNHVHPLCIFKGHVVYSFPVKHNWWEKADIALITRSCVELNQLATNHQLILLPRPGCGNGHLKWEDVKPLLETLLPDNVIVVSK